MFTFTESAGALLAQMIEQEKLADDMAFRIISNSEGLFFEQDIVRPGDAKFEHEGRVVLILDAGMVQMLEDDELYAEEGKLALRTDRQ